MKGLDQFLDKIKASPRPTLVNRYLALVAELPAEEEKTTRVLDLAAALVKSRPMETLRLAHMVYTADRYNFRALDLVIEAFTVKGRAGKAHVLKLEKAKLEKALAEGTAQREPSARLPKALFEPADSPAAEQSRIAEIDLGPVEMDEAGEVDALARLFPTDPAPEGTMVSNVSLNLEALDARPGISPFDTVLPFDQNERAPEALADAAISHAEMIAPTLNLGTAPRQEPGAHDVASPVPKVEAPRLAPDHIAKAELFDHYWKLGFVNEARGVLEDSREHEAEGWWRARHAVAQRAMRLVESAPQPAAPDGAAPAAPLDLLPPGDFWRAMHHELARLGARGHALLVPFTKVERVAGHLVGRAPEGLARQIAELDHRVPGLADALELKWTLIQGLWGGEPDQSLAGLLEELRLTDASPAFFGLYLDALLASRRSRRALVVARRALDDHPQLAWARAAWARLPRIFAAQRLRAFAWSEDHGVQALRDRLATRPEPKLGGVLPVPAKRGAQA